MGVPVTLYKESFHAQPDPAGDDHPRHRSSGPRGHLRGRSGRRSHRKQLVVLDTDQRPTDLGHRRRLTGAGRIRLHPHPLVGFDRDRHHDRVDHLWRIGHDHRPDRRAGRRAGGRNPGCRPGSHSDRRHGEPGLHPPGRGAGSRPDGSQRLVLLRGRGFRPHPDGPHQRKRGQHLRHLLHPRWGGHLRCPGRPVCLCLRNPRSRQLVRTRRPVRQSLVGPDR